MTTMHDKPGETGGDVAAAPHTEPAETLRRDAVTREVCRGVGRMLRALSFAIVHELCLPNGRRADIVALSPAGDIWIVEVKSCLDDLRVDTKWPEYRDFSDALFFAVAPDFPRDTLPVDTGLIVADRYGADILREAPATRLAPARRKAMTLRFARAAALSLQLLTDPGSENA